MRLRAMPAARALLLTGVGCVALAGQTVSAQTAAPAAAQPDAQTRGRSGSPGSDQAPVREIVVTASTRNLLGVAETSSQGSVTKQELELRPVYRVGQLLETIPGLSVTAHSGEGKANQYLLRGFNLDHGTDLATFIDGMPVNMRTHAHGQGYTDLNFLIPEVAGGVDFTKGPYYAAQGDFSAVGADHLRLVNELPTQAAVSFGTVGDQRLFAAGSHDLGDVRVLAAGELVHLDGPWDHPDNFRKVNLALRAGGGSRAEGWGVTALYYRGLWNATTDQPARAIDQGLIGRFGTLDPSDGGQSERFSLSGELARTFGDWRLRANAYAIRQQLTLWNNFTHLLDDPVNGDQHGQNDRRTFAGGEASLTHQGRLFGAESETVVGLQGRFDHIYVDLRRTRARADLGTVIADRVDEGSLGVWGQNTTRWAPWLRTIVGLREDAFWGSDDNLAGGLSGDESEALLQPKGSLVLGPWRKTELYFSAGEGFHSNDVRAGSASDLTGTAALARPIFLVKARGAEIGARTSLIPRLQAAATLFQTEFDSELTYDADVGQTSAGRPSRRQGIEVTGQYRPFRWLELNANIAVSRARFTDREPAGAYIPDSPGFVGSVGLRLDHLGPWYGAVQYRDLGAHPLIADNSVRSPGYREINLNLGYRITPKLRIELDVFNLTDSGDHAADYLYADRISLSEPVEGVSDLHYHPLEPRSARLTVAASF